MRKFWKGLGWVALAVLSVGAYAGYRIGLGKPFTINQLADRQAFLYLVQNPELFTQAGILDGTFLDHHSGRLTAVGVRKRDDEYAMAARFITQVREFDRAALGRQDQITYDILLDQWRARAAYRPFEWLSSEGLYAISSMFGAEATLPTFLQSVHVVRNGRSARNYVTRLEAMGKKLDDLTAEMQRQAAAAVVLPIALLDKSLVVIADIVRPAPADSPLVTGFGARLRNIRSLDESQRTSLLRAATAALSNRVYPAYGRMSAALVALRPRAAAQGAGVGRLPDGAAYYALALKEMTSTDYAPDQVHELGLAEVARVTGEIDALLKAQGLATGTAAERIGALQRDPRFQLPNTDAGRAQALARYRQILDEVAARMPDYFRSIPSTRLTVERMEVAAEKGAAQAEYRPAALDGSRPGVFVANLRDVASRPVWSMKTLAYHEGIPGHHFQISIALALHDMPLVRQEPLYTAFTEGWALYAEQLAAEIGMYRDDPLGDLGRLQAELFRSARLVTDTGLHAKGWSREKAIAYMVGTTGMDPAEVESEVERYMALPGQACAYKLGQLKILTLRERARAALGSRFDLKGFHAVVLENGAVPLTLLEELVDEWIARTRATPGSRSPVAGSDR